MASPEADAAKAAFLAFRDGVIADGRPMTLESMRASAEMTGQLATVPSGVRWEDDVVGGRRCRWAIPDAGADDRVVQYVHGGGYVVGSLDSFERLTGHLAAAVGCRVLSVDYGLAPEEPHPAAVGHSAGVYEALLAEFDPGRIAISGDSAGGGLTIATLVKLRDDGIALPAAAVTLSPWVDLEGTGDSMRTNADADVLVDPTALRQMADLFLAGGDARDPLAAPLYADLRGLPPLYLQVGGDETLLDDSCRLASRAGAAGVDVRLDVFAEMQHVFQVFVGAMPEADDAIARIGTWLRPHLGL